MSYSTQLTAIAAASFKSIHRVAARLIY